MPRKWQIYERVRGVALSRERFQFIFKYEHDMNAILEKGVHTFNEWSLAMEKWVEIPPPDYLQVIPIWVQLRNVPVNHYTVAAVTALGEFAGQVIGVALDTTKSHSRDFVRVQISFDVSKPLRRSKVVNLPKGAGSVSVLYYYERIQKRCYTCQRLTHEQNRCPIRIKERQDKALEIKMNNHKGKFKEKIIKESGPLFGVIDEEQIEINPNTGRPKIAKEVVQEMQQYLMVENGPERIVREERIKASLAELKNDSLGQKTCLRLEPLPMISTNIDKGKGVVFDYGKKELEGIRRGCSVPNSMFMGAAFNEASGLSSIAMQGSRQSDPGIFRFSTVSSSLLDGSTVMRASSSDACSSGTNLGKGKSRRRPLKRNRCQKDQPNKSDQGYEQGEVADSTFKRKAADEAHQTS